VVPHANLDESRLGFVLDEVRNQVECSVRDYESSMHRSSTTAIAAILNSLDRVENGRACKNVLGALLCVLGENIASHQEIFDAKIRLQCLVSSNGA